MAITAKHLASRHEEPACVCEMEPAAAENSILSHYDSFALYAPLVTKRLGIYGR